MIGNKSDISTDSFFRIPIGKTTPENAERADENKNCLHSAPHRIEIGILSIRAHNSV